VGGGGCGGSEAAQGGAQASAHTPTPAARQAGMAASASGCHASHAPRPRGLARSARRRAHECVKSAGVDGRADFGIVYRSTANRPPRGTPIGMARRMPVCDTSFT
jgi:hypothetical protein